MTRTHYNTSLVNSGIVSNFLDKLESKLFSNDEAEDDYQCDWKPLPGPQTEAYYSKADILGYGGAAGGGKLLRLSEPIATPYGFMPMGLLDVGDTIYDKDGSPCSITAVSATEPEPVLYKFTFDDSSTVISCVDHQWVTFDAVELAALSRRSPEYRARRREMRPSRVTGNKSDKFTESITIRNKAHPPTIKPTPTGSIRTTRQIVDTLVTKSGRSNHAIPVTGALQSPILVLPVDPYVLGAWLGDGTNYSGGFTSADPEIWKRIESAGYQVSHGSQPYSHYIRGLKTRLRTIEVLRNKHIPLLYLRASIEQRLDLLTGLMDTDGTVVRDSGSVEFCNTNESIIDGVVQLITSLGWKVNKREGVAKLYSKICGAKWTLKFTPSRYVFHLKRKKNIQRLSTRRTTRFRYIVSAESVKSEPGRCITVDSPSSTYLVGHSLIPTHNSDLILGLAATAHRKSAIFRRVFPNLRALIERSREILNAEGVQHAKDSFNESLHRWTIGNGKMIEFEACQYEKDKEKQRGRPRDLYAFDEAPELTRSQIEFITAWLRSTKKDQRCRIVLTFNPPAEESGTWIIDYFMPWFAYLFPDVYSYPNPAAPGEIRWFASVDGEEIEVENGDTFKHKNETIHPLSRTFIPARLEDNPYLADTNYRAVLQSMPEPFRSQLLYGDMTLATGDNPFQLIPTAWIKRSQDRWVEPSARLDAIGIDVARGGKDQTILARRYGHVCGRLQKFPGIDTPDGAAVSALVIRETAPGPTLGIDILAVGSSPVDYLVDYGYDVIPINGSAKGEREEYGELVQVTDKSGLLKMKNLRAAMYWNLRELLENDEIDLPPDRELLIDLAAPRMKPTVSGIQIEGKDKIKESIGHSPDCGDAVAYAFWVQGSLPPAKPTDMIYG